MPGSMWRAKSQLIAPWLEPKPRWVLDHQLRYPELRSVEAAGGPELEPYQGLAEIWDAYSSLQLADYPSFVTALARARGIDLRSVLDLACGTGTLAVRLNGVAAEVVGLEVSEPMLAVARRHTATRPAVRFAHGDFRDFTLGRQFDVAVCASNSLNYVADRGELARVFAAVGKHLRPGGLFVFDTSTECGMRSRSGLYFHIDLGGPRFALRFSYDDARRKESTTTILASGVETHPRIPLDPADIEAAAAGTGFDIDDYFSSPFIPGRWKTGGYAFFVLTRRG